MNEDEEKWQSWNFLSVTGSCADIVPQKRNQTDGNLSKRSRQGFQLLALAKYLRYV
jgi:hypothetical protein